MSLWKSVWKFVQMTRRVGGWKAALQMTRQAPLYLTLFQRLLADVRVPLAAKALLVGALAFAISPLNLPQYIPVIGALDDLGIALFAINGFLKLVPAAILDEHRRAVGLDETALS